MKVLVEHIAGALAGKNLEINRPMIRFGRAPDNDVAFHLTQDINSSAHHAELRAEQGQVYLNDLNSTNGLFLNGRRIQRATIEAGNATSPAVALRDDRIAEGRQGAPERHFGIEVCAVLVEHHHP